MYTPSWENSLKSTGISLTKSLLTKQQLESVLNFASDLLAPENLFSEMKLFFSFFLGLACWSQMTSYIFIKLTNIYIKNSNIHYEHMTVE